MNTTNKGYKRERAVLAKISPDIVPVPFSGSKWQVGREDGSTETALYQVKSTQSQIISVRWRDLSELVEHCNPVQVPVFVLDYVKPLYGIQQFPDDQWVAVRLSDYQTYMLPHIGVESE